MIAFSFKTAWRNIIKSKIYSTIAVLGLAIGISASLVIYLIVSYDLGFDKFEKDRAHVYRVVSEMKFSGQMVYNPGVPEPLANAVHSEVGGVQSVIPFLQPDFDIKVTTPDNKAFKKQQNIIFADAEYFNLLSYQWISGDPQSATQQPSQVVLTAGRAKLYFPDWQPSDIIGKTITYNDSITVTVAGVVKDLDQQTDFSFKEFISLPTIRNSGFKYSFSPDNWYATNGTSQLFVKLSPKASPGQAEAQLSGLIRKYRSEQKRDAQNSYLLRLQPLADLHFDGNYGTFVQWDSGERIGTVSRNVLYGLVAAAVLLLLLGCINFINLATAQATSRAKEVGIRKTMGSSKGQLRWQFIQETLLITTVAAAISILMVPFLLKAFAGFVPEGLQFSIGARPEMIVFLIGLVIVVTLLAGFYPSMVLASYNPIDVLKNRTIADGSSRKTRVRKTLTVSQFVVAQAFIMCAIVVGRQIHYMLNTDIGYKKDAVVYFYINGNGPDNRRLLVQQLANIPGISRISLSNDPPTSSNSWNGPWKYNGGATPIQTQAQMKFVDTGFIGLYGLRLIAGQNTLTSDTMRSVLINETYARTLGFKSPGQAVGKWLDRKGKLLPITGVVADFHHSSMHEEIKPLVIANDYKSEYCVNLLLPANASNRQGAEAWQSTLAAAAARFKALYPQQDFEYHFLDDSIAQFYKAEEGISMLVNWATALAILISCMGLLGLVIFTTNSRTREIGIRKVLGASVAGVIMLLSKDFLKLVILAFAIAAPLAWWAAHQWLSSFAYRTAVSWWMFGATGLSMLLLAILTLSILVIRAALANPVKNLRTE